jgi:hypothetical protein
MQAVIITPENAATVAAGLRKCEKGLFHLCAWCDSALLVTNLLVADGGTVSHGICATHRNSLLGGK